ncbi:plasmid partitioning protein RepA [Sinorhizobium meliloti]|uniref:plasmid partitioning protein RepA n=1 Tax=Rhizobium meliloti TaxID=382 RepID=UPI000AADA1D6|nr:plasmid partitioning protein RepA [Sinorhizobium meliloti]
MRKKPVMLKDPECKVKSETTSERLGRQAAAIADRLSALGDPVGAIQAMKTLRSFSSGEVAQIVGVSDGYLRQLSLDGLGPMPELGTAGRRFYTLRQINELRAYLAQVRPKEALKFWPRRREGEKLQVIAIANLKGGSAKTTTSFYLAQGLALQGYRVLAIDLDPQASLSAMFGHFTEYRLRWNKTLYGAIRYDDQRVSMRSVILETHFESLHLVPGNEALIEFEHDSRRLASKEIGVDDREIGVDDRFFSRVASAINEVEGDYDVVIIDCPPRMDVLSIGALNAATSMLVPILPLMANVALTSYFLKVAKSRIDYMERVGARLNYDFLKFVVIRHDPRDASEQHIVGLLRDLLGTDVLEATVWKSAAIADAQVNVQSLYEIKKGAVGRLAYQRAMESLNAVNAEVIDLISKVWRRSVSGVSQAWRLLPAGKVKP